MKIEKKITDNCSIKYNKEDQSIKPIFSAVKKAEEFNNNFFKIKPNKYWIEIVYSNEEYDKKTNNIGVKTWRGGYVLNNKITIISPSIQKLKFDPYSYFLHEINHIYYISIVESYHPVWFNEGMATFLMGTYDLDEKEWKKAWKDSEKPERFLYYRYIKNKYYKNGTWFYSLSYMVYKYLHENFGEKTIIKLIKEFAKKPGKKEFDILFKKYFNMTIKEAVKKTIV